MKSLLALLIFNLVVYTSTGQVTESKASKPDPAKKIQLVEVSCGKCKLGLSGKTCALAVRIAGKAWYADGADIDDFGDAHEHDGMCNAIRKAEVQGKISGDRFNITYIKLIPEEKKKNQ